MNSIVRWNPRTNLLERTFGPGFGRVFDDFVTGSGRIAEDDVAATSWAPAADVKETADSLFVYVELPGLQKDDIDVSLDSGVLTVRGERRFVKDDTKETYHRQERFFGKFSRSFRLPRNVDSGHVRAGFADGLLTLELPKSEEAKPRQIEIN